MGATKTVAAIAPQSNSKFWWSNALFFVGMHIAAAVGIYFKPPWAVHPASLALCIIGYQAACFGITIGYHRLYSHRAFRASVGVRMVLAALGSMAFQGSIKVGGACDIACIMFTDDPVHDPYCATKGLIFSHMGWIFYKPKYTKMDLINKDDLESDPVVRFQHKHYIPLALFFGFAVPTAIGLLWNDVGGAYVWGGFVSRIIIWHCTFLVNSLAHWDGLQPYSDENTSRGTLIMAILTCGEGNHNFHAFPQDFRAGPSSWDYDPSKWIILTLHRFGWATGLRRAREEDVTSAKAWMALHHGHGHDHEHKHEVHISGDESSALSSSESTTEDTDAPDAKLESWDRQALDAYVKAKQGRCVVLLDGYAVDVTPYLGDHPGGALLLREHSVRSSAASDKESTIHDASSAFHGGMNNHSRAARRRMRELRVSRVKL